MCLLLIKVAERRESSGGGGGGGGDGDYVRFPGRRNSNRGGSTSTSGTASTRMMTSATSNNPTGFVQQQSSPFFTLEELQQQQQQQQQFRDEQQQTDYLLSGSAPIMFSGGYMSQTREMSAMVTALTNVVSGQRSGEWNFSHSRPPELGAPPPPFVAGSVIQSANSPSSAYSSSSSGSWAGQKRGRDQDDTVSAFPDRVFRGFDDFKAGDSSSSATNPSGSFFFQYFFPFSQTKLIVHIFNSRASPTKSEINIMLFACFFPNFQSVNSIFWHLN